jgi:hypothetical protein
MTLMQKYQNQFKALGTLLKPLNINPVGLNKTSPKYKPYSYGESSYTKGVAADHIRIFPLSKDESFAFAFYYENMVDPVIMVTIKRGENIYPEDTAQYNPEGFRVKLNELVKLLTVLQKAKQLTVASLESTVKTLFLSAGSYSLDQEIKEVTTKVKDQLGPIKQKNQQVIKDYSALKKTVQEKKDLLADEVRQAQRDHNVITLRKQLEQALTQVEKIEKTMTKKLNLESLESQLRKLKWDFESYQRTVRDLVVKNSRHLPKEVQEKILAEIDKN